MKDTIVRRLAVLDAEYTAAVNAAVEEDRDDLIEQLVAQYPIAVQALTAAEAA